MILLIRLFLLNQGFIFQSKFNNKLGLYQCRKSLKTPLLIVMASAPQYPPISFILLTAIHIVGGKNDDLSDVIIKKIQRLDVRPNFT